MNVSLLSIPFNIPEQCVEDCAASGDVEALVTNWQAELAFEVPADVARRHLGYYGCWDDLDTVEEVVLMRRLLWVVCGALSDGEEYYIID